MTTAEVLIAARAKIADPACWIQGQFQSGKSYCALAAINASSPMGFDASAARKVMYQHTPGQYSIVSFNDSHTHAEVLALFDKAIAAEQAR